MDDGWVEELRGPHESEKEWTIKRSFLLAHKDNLDRERLICLATCFINMEMYGCGYPDEVMHEVRGLAARVGELEDYRRDKKEKESNRIKFVKGEASGIQPECSPPKKAKVTYSSFVSAGSIIHKEPPISQPPVITEPEPMDTAAVPILNTEENALKSRVVRTPGGIILGDRKPELHEAQRAPYIQVSSKIQLHMKTIKHLFPCDAKRPCDSFILRYSPNAMDMVNGSTQAENITLETRLEDDNQWKLFAGEDTLASVSGKVVGPAITGVQDNSQFPAVKRVHSLLTFRLLEQLITTSWMVIRKDLSSASQAVTSDSIQETEEEKVNQHKGMSLLKSMGWTEGSGLGSQGQGMTNPIALETTINRQGFGYGGPGRKTLAKCAEEYFIAYIRAGRTDTLIFSNEFSSDDRKILHQVARRNGLVSVSKGKGEKRCLTVTQKGRSLGDRLQDLVDCNVYENDWCIIVPPHTNITWGDNDDKDE